MSLNEFDIIARYFNHGLLHPLVQKGIGDDCAIFSPPKDSDLLFTIDTLNSGVHFFADVDPYDLGYKALAVSLSDIAAMGGKPECFLLSLTLPMARPEWLEKFASGLFHLAEQYSIQLIGGDTTKGPLAVTTQVIGTVPRGSAICRKGARRGDDIYVSGTLGDAGLALKVYRQEVSLPPEDTFFLLAKLHRPEPPVLLGLHLRNLAHAAIDISDGLVADLQHILDESHVGASLDLESLPISQTLQSSLTLPAAIELALTSGDDYELCFTAASHLHTTIEELAVKLNCRIQKIGKIEQQKGLRLYFQGNAYDVSGRGYQHF